MKSLEVLIAARAKIASKADWAPGFQDIDADGASSAVENAVKLTASSSLERVARDEGSEESLWGWTMALRAIMQTLKLRGEDYLTLVHWSCEKGRTHADVLRLFDETISRGKAKCQGVNQ